MATAKRALLFIGITIFTAACSGLAYFFYLSSGQLYFLVIALVVLTVGVSNITSKILTRLAGRKTGQQNVTHRESLEQCKYNKRNNEKG